MHIELYEVAERYKDILNLIDGDTITRDDVSGTLNALEDEFKEKADSIGCLIKSLSADIEAFKTERNRLMERQKENERKIEYLKDYIHEQMEETGIKSIETPRNKIRITDSVKVVVNNEEQFKVEHPELCRVTSKVDPDKTKIKEILKGGGVVDGAMLVKSRNLSVK